MVFFVWFFSLIDHYGNDGIVNMKTDEFTSYYGCLHRIYLFKLRHTNIFAVFGSTNESSPASFVFDATFPLLGIGEK